MATESKKRPGDKFTAARRLESALAKLSPEAEEKAVADLNAKHEEVIRELREKFAAGRTEVIAKASPEVRALVVGAVKVIDAEMPDSAPLTDSALTSAAEAAGFDADDDGPAGESWGGTADGGDDEIKLSPRLLQDVPPPEPGSVHIVDESAKAAAAAARKASGGRR